ncbi:MAG: tyrosine-type recombinase/integrase, partial [Alphaproteobacteria bacterium]|nr:tyrosine-type recombinase/integrase [Alphaproteobacteria bacterium]
RKGLAMGLDPSLVKKQEKRLARQNAGNTFESLAREWHEHQQMRWSEGHAKDVLHRLSIDIFPEIGFRPIKDILPPEILDALRKVEDRGAYEIARRLLQNCGQVFRYAVATGRLDSDPTRDLKGALKPFKKSHFAALEVKDLPTFLYDLETNKARLYPQTIRAIKLLMLTFVRTGELIGARWEEIDLDGAQWEIPAERMKMRRPHMVPLSRQVITLLHEQHEITGRWPWVFPNQIRPKDHMSNNTVLMALRRMGYKGKMTGHGFRALAMSTIKERLGYRHEVVDRQLAHAPKNKVDSAYDRAKFLDERKIMMQNWADYLESLASGCSGKGAGSVGKKGKCPL